MFAQMKSRSKLSSSALTEEQKFARRVKAGQGTDMLYLIGIVVELFLLYAALLDQ